MNINIREYVRAVNEISLNYMDIYSSIGMFEDKIGKKLLKKLQPLNLILIKALGMKENSNFYNSSERNYIFNDENDYCDPEYEFDQVFTEFYITSFNYTLDDSSIDEFLNKLKMLLTLHIN